MRKLLLMLCLLLFLVACETTKITDEPAECSVDNDCVPATCCHPSECVPSGQTPDCEGIFCTMECKPGTLDCGQGSCVCESGICKEKIKN